MMNMKLDDTFSLEYTGGNFILYENIEGFRWDENKNKVPNTTQKKSFYGTLYQALSGYLIASVDLAEDLDNAKEKAKDVMETLDKLKKEIKKNFRTEVQVAK